jgi:hypothetical protein
MLYKIVNHINNTYKDLQNDNITFLIVLLVLLLYGSLYINSIAPLTVNLYNNNIFKLILFILISYIFTVNISLSIFIIILILLTLQQVSINNINKNITI